jgi:hypothetical protein
MSDCGSACTCLGSSRLSYVTLVIGSLDSSVVQRWDTGWMISGSSPGRDWEFFSLHHCVQSGSAARPASYPMDTWGSFPGDKAAGEWS